MNFWFLALISNLPYLKLDPFENIFPLKAAKGIHFMASDLILLTNFNWRTKKLFNELSDDSVMILQYFQVKPQSRIVLVFYQFLRI